MTPQGGQARGADGTGGLKVKDKTAETTTVCEALEGPETHPNGPGTALGTFVGGHIQYHPLLAV